MLIFGIALFALGIIVSIVLHEYGHYRVALSTGMRVRRFFVGFGPTVWSVHRNGIEYGFKALPLGGFCDIAGMTAYDELTPEDQPKAMWRQSAWKRVAVLLAGPIMNIVLAVLLFYTVAVGWGLVNRNAERVPVDQLAAVIDEPCAAGGTTCGPGEGPAGEAGLLSGDRITEVNGRSIGSWLDLQATVGDLDAPTASITAIRNGETINAEVTLATAVVDGAERKLLGVRPGPEAVPAAIRDDPKYQTFRTYDAVSAVPATIAFTGEMTSETMKGLVSFPSKIPGVVRSIFGEERAADSPVSVVGASHVGGQIVERGWWDSFLLLLGGLNLFIGAFNLIPLTPFDGGHIAVVAYEKIRDALRRARGLAPGGPADYEKLAPLTLTVFTILIAVSLIVITADIVNPILL